MAGNNNVTARLADKYCVSVEQAQAMNARVSGVAAEEGLEYHLDRAQVSNMFDAHRLIHLAARHGLQDAMEERLMQAYFTEGEAVGDAATLVRLAAQVGLDETEARQVTESDAFAEDVQGDIRRARLFGITGVPFFAIDERYGVSGAQPADVLRQALEEAWAESHPLVRVGTSGSADAACEGDSCAI